MFKRTETSLSVAKFYRIYRIGLNLTGILMKKFFLKKLALIKYQSICMRFKIACWKKIVFKEDGEFIEKKSASWTITFFSLGSFALTDHHVKYR